MNGIKTYFDAHPEQRLLIKAGILLVGGLALVEAAIYLSHAPMAPEWALALGAALGYVQDKFKVLEALGLFNEWPILGAGKKRK